MEYINRIFYVCFTSGSKCIRIVVSSFELLFSLFPIFMLFFCILYKEKKLWITRRNTEKIRKKWKTCKKIATLWAWTNVWWRSPHYYWVLLLTVGILFFFLYSLRYSLRFFPSVVFIIIINGHPLKLSELYHNQIPLLNRSKHSDVFLNAHILALSSDF